MKNRTLFIFLALSCFIIILSCDRASDLTEIRYSTTISVLDQQTIPYILSEEQLISGFYLGYDLNDRPLRQTLTYQLPVQRLEAAGSEAIVCNDGKKYNFGSGSTLLNFIRVIGDTGGDDVSDDADCNCDTRIDAIEFNGLEVAFDVGTGIQFSPSRLEGKDLMCPNIPNGDHIRGDREFGGPVNVSAAVTLRVSEDRRALLADITYHVIETE